MSVDTKELEIKKSRGKATKTPSESGNGTASSRVSSMQRNDSTYAKSDVSDGLGLSGVLPSNLGKPTNIISGSPEKVERRVIKTIRDMNLEEHILMLNAYKKLLHKIPTIKGLPGDLQDYLTATYKDWVKSRIGYLLGSSGSTETFFTAEEVTALKALASKVLATAQNPQPQKPTPTPQPTQGTPVQRQPLKESVDVEKFTKTQLEFLKQLSDMDRNGPQY